MKELICQKCGGFTPPTRNKLIQSKAYTVLLRIFQDKIEQGLPLSEVEKTAVKSAKQIPDKSPALAHLCKCFFQSDL